MAEEFTAEDFGGGTSVADEFTPEDFEERQASPEEFTAEDFQPEKSDLRTQLAGEKKKLQREGAMAKAGITAADIGEKALGVVSAMNPFEMARRVVNPYNTTLVSPEAATRAVEFLDPFGVAPKGSARQGAQQFAGETAAGLTAPDALAAIAAGKVSPAIPARYFQAQMIPQAGAAAARLAQAQTPAEGVKAGLETAMAVGAPLAIEAGLARTPKPTATETTPQVPAIEMPKTPTETGVYPAVREVGGKVDVGEAGQTHPDIIKEEGLKATDIDQRGFVDPQGQFLDREQAAQVTGQPTEMEPGRQHSTDLPEAKPEAAPETDPASGRCHRRHEVRPSCGFQVPRVTPKWQFSLINPETGTGTTFMTEVGATHSEVARKAGIKKMQMAEGIGDFNEATRLYDEKQGNAPKTEAPKPAAPPVETKPPAGATEPASPATPAPVSATEPAAPAPEAKEPWELAR